MKIHGSFEMFSNLDLHVVRTEVWPSKLNLSRTAGVSGRFLAAGSDADYSEIRLILSAMGETSADGVAWETRNTDSSSC